MGARGVEARAAGVWMARRWVASHQGAPAGPCRCTTQSVGLSPPTHTCPTHPPTRWGRWRPPWPPPQTARPGSAPTGAPAGRGAGSEDGAGVGPAGRPVLGPTAGAPDAQRVGCDMSMAAQPIQRPAPRASMRPSHAGRPAWCLVVSPSASMYASARFTPLPRTASTRRHVDSKASALRLVRSRASILPARGGEGWVGAAGAAGGIPEVAFCRLWLQKQPPTDCLLKTALHTRTPASPPPTRHPSLPHPR